jgi:hypothetical protein
MLTNGKFNNSYFIYYLYFSKFDVRLKSQSLCHILDCDLTVALWLVADFEGFSYQVIPNFNKSENIETSTATAITIARVGGSIYLNSTN